MSMEINSGNYSQFFKGMQDIQSYGSAEGQKKQIARYEFNTTDENGNHVMDKMSKEETMRTMNEISAMYGDSVIVSFSGDGFAALAEGIEKKGLNPTLREIKMSEADYAYVEEQQRIANEKAKERLSNESELDKCQREFDERWKREDPEAFKKYQELCKDEDPMVSARFMNEWIKSRVNGTLKKTSTEAADKEALDKLSSKFKDVSFGKDDGSTSLFGKNRFSVLLSDDELSILKYGSDSAKKKIYDIIEKSLKALSDIETDETNNKWMDGVLFGIKIGSDNKASYLAQNDSGSYIADTFEELVDSLKSHT